MIRKNILSMRHSRRNSKLYGFTLIELSIVLVIIGLIIGGILTGVDLIAAAAVRAQISQLEKYNTAVRTFQNKYGYLPGDIPDPYASNFGFAQRGTQAGQGDGNGILEGWWSLIGPNHFGSYDNDGENALFWADLSTAQLIDASIIAGNTSSNLPNATTPPSIPITASSSPSLSAWLPVAKISNGAYVSVYSDGQSINYFSITGVSNLVMSTTWETTIFSVQQAYMIDKKMDDSLPQSGAVTTCYGTNGGGSIAWSGGPQNFGAGTYGGTSSAGTCIATTAATPYQTRNCYDNATAASPAGVAGAAEVYSTRLNATTQNCNLSFRFQ